MKKIGVIFIFIFLLKNSLYAYSSDPKSFVSELVNDVLTKLNNKSVTKEEKSQFIEEIASSNVDIDALSLYTLGELRKSTNKEKLNEYQKIFEKYFLKSLTSRLTDYSSSKFEVIEAFKFKLYNSKFNCQTG